jgi:hypothetical protein
MICEAMLMFFFASLFSFSFVIPLFLPFFCFPCQFLLEWDLLLPSLLGIEGPSLPDGKHPGPFQICPIVSLLILMMMRTTIVTGLVHTYLRNLAGLNSKSWDFWRRSSRVMYVSMYGEHIGRCTHIYLFRIYDRYLV